MYGRVELIFRFQDPEIEMHQLGEISRHFFTLQQLTLSYLILFKNCVEQLIPPFQSKAALPHAMAVAPGLKFLLVSTS